MKTIIYNNNFMETNTYVLEDDEKSYIIDPCVKYSDLPKRIKDKLKGVFITHGHFDHFMELESYKNKELSFYMHKRCLEKIKNSFKNCSFMGFERLEVNLENEKIIFLKENDIIDGIKVYEFFGHTDCSLGYEINGNIYCGDSVFKGSIGRCDLYSASNSEMKKTIEKFKSFKDDFALFPGHGDATMLSEEKKNNVYFGE